MKKWIVFILAISIISLAACSQGQTAGNAEEEKDDVQADTDVENTNGESEETTKDDSEEGKEPQQEETKDNNQEETGTNESDEVVKQEPVEPKYTLNGVWSVVPLEGKEDVNEQVVLLTIDDAPDKYGLEMAKTLKELNAPAIFFVNGHFIDTDEEKEMVKQIHDMGFAIGNHTMTHQKLDEVSEEKQREEIVELSNRIEEIIGERPKFYRAPHGVNTEYSKQLVEDEGMLLMNWSYGYDWNSEYMTEKAIADIMVNTNLLGNGSNLLMHDREWTAKALDDIVKGLRDKGYGLVDPDEIQVPSK